MNDDFLKVKLRRVIRRYQWLGLWRKLAIWWAIAAAVAGLLIVLQNEAGFMSALTLPIFAAVAVAVAVGVAIHHYRETPDYRWVAKKIEAAHPELNGVLLTAVQQELPEGAPNFFQHRVLQEAIARSQETDWRKDVASSHVGLAHAAHLAALACFVFAVMNLRVPTIHGQEVAWVGTDGVAIQPGNTSIEKGDSLVVVAKFGGSLPPNVTLVVRETNAASRNIPLIRNLTDPMFGGSVQEVNNDLTYHLEYRGQKSPEFKVTVYEHPKLVRSDVDLTFPDYTKQPPKHIEDTRRVSAVEGTKLEFALQLNKPVKSAQLIARDGKKTPLPLTVSADKAVATLGNFVPVKTQSYDLQLIDAEGRANKVAAPFVIDVQPNRAPEVRLASPRGDVRPSALEEITFDGTIFDDFGASTYGLAYSIGGGEAKSIELGTGVAAKEKRAFNTLIKLEDIGAKPDDLISWYAWAEDTGPDGKVRRTSGDLFFAEVRPFDEIFRESQQGEQEQQQGGGGGGGGGQQQRRLTELQKQIINATWKLQRDGATPKYGDDVKVVRDSQEQALTQANEAMGEARGPAEQAMWKDATQQMIKALEQLDNAAKTPGPLAQALPAEQSAYQSLLKLQARETAVTRRQRGGGGGGGGGGGNQRQIDQLDLQQSQNRYETQRQARAPQNRERTEQLAVMNRLQDLARRQQDLNERLREVQTALQEARTEQEKEEARRRLKRLQEEQQQMLADADEVRQRMDRAENQSAMTQQRQQLDQTREDLQNAAEAAQQGAVGQALASGTRAQRQLQEMRDEMRKENSSQFAEDMREMRSEARELSRQQEEIGQKIDQLANQRNQRKSLSDTGERKELIDQLEQQRERMDKIIDQATKISEQAENTEPLLSRQLYDSLRTATQDDGNSVKQARDDLAASGMGSYELQNRLQRTGEREGTGKAFEVTRDMVNENTLAAAGRASQRARAQAENLRRGVEKAADSVLGDEAEQLRLATNEIDQLTDALTREIARDRGEQGGAQQNGQPGQPGRQGQQGQQGDQRQAGTQGGQGQQQPGEQNGQQPGAGQQPGDQPGQQPGEGQQPGQRGGQRQVARNNQQQGRGQGQGQQGENGQQGQNGQQAGQGGQGQQGQGQQGQQGQAGQQGQQGQQGQNGQGGQGSGGQGQQGGDLRNAGNQNQQPNGRGQRGGQQRLAGGGNQRGGNRLGVDDLMNGTYEGGVGGGGWGNLGSRPIGPLTGEDFNQWNERLRDVEQIVDSPELRLQVAQAGERMRTLRRDFRQDLKKPDWVNVELQIIKPLVEVRQRLAEELARRESKESLAPIDRDPVPTRFAESVRRYYEELGKDQ